MSTKLLALFSLQISQQLSQQISLQLSLQKPLLLILLLILAGCDEDKALPEVDVSSTKSENASLLENTTAASAISQKALVDHIKTLASDEFGGRGPGTPGEELTVNYLASAFKAMGLAPANGDSYFQAVPLTSVEVTNKPNLIFSGGSGDDLTLTYPDNQVIWSRQQIEAASVTDSELVFVGYGINAPERNWNDYAAVDVRGKTVVMLVNDPGYATQDPDLFNGNAMTYYGRWTYKFDEAARQGAAAAIIVHDTKPAAYPWTTVSTSWTGPQFDVVRENKGADLVAVEGWITKDNAIALFKKVGMDLHAMYEAAKTPGFKAVAMNVTASASIESKTNNVSSRNVAAILKGSEAPEEVFIYMAHWDHLGTDPAIEGDGIYNGALDNATGTSGLLEIAKAFTSLEKKPRRSVMFIAVTAEEQGLLGSAYYAANPIYPLADTVAGLNMDVLNAIGPTNDVTVTGLGLSQLDGYLEKQAMTQNRVLKPGKHPERGYFYRSDHFELSKLGVPMLYPKSGNDHREKGVEYAEQKGNEYIAKHYHQPSDEYDPSWDLSGAVEDLQLYFLTGLDIANSSDWPQWSEGTEFKAVRDRQRQRKLD